MPARGLPDGVPRGLDGDVVGLAMRLPWGRRTAFVLGGPGATSVPHRGRGVRVVGGRRGSFPAASVFLSLRAVVLAAHGYLGGAIVTYLDPDVFAPAAFARGVYLGADIIDPETERLWVSVLRPDRTVLVLDAANIVRPVAARGTVVGSSTV